MDFKIIDHESTELFKPLASLHDNITVILEDIDHFQRSFEKSCLLVLCSQKMLAKLLK